MTSPMCFMRLLALVITLEQGVAFVIRCLGIMEGGEIFVPKIPSVKVTQLAQVIAPECTQEVIGIRPGEKLHETMVPEDDARLTIEFSDHFVIQPTHSFWNPKDFLGDRSGKACPDGFRYSSDSNSWWLDDEEVAALVDDVKSGSESFDIPTAHEPKFIVGG